MFAFAVEIVAFGWLWATVNVVGGAGRQRHPVLRLRLQPLAEAELHGQHRDWGGGGRAGARRVVGGDEHAGLAAGGAVRHHFLLDPTPLWALAIRYRDDYQAAEVPMLPAVTTLRRTASRIILYTVVLWALTLLFAPVADMGAIYTVSAVVSVPSFSASRSVYRDPQPKPAMALFGWSITYVTLLFGAMAVDVVVRNGV